MSSPPVLWTARAQRNLAFAGLAHPLADQLHVEVRIACDDKLGQVSPDHACQRMPKQRRQCPVAVKNRAIRPQGRRALADALYDYPVRLISALKCKDLLASACLHDKGIDFAVRNRMQDRLGFLQSRKEFFF